MCGDAQKLSAYKNNNFIKSVNSVFVLMIQKQTCRHEYLFRALLYKYMFKVLNSTGNC